MAHELESPLYRPRVVPNKKRKQHELTKASRKRLGREGG